jgi:hypothetical protein
LTPLCLAVHLGKVGMVKTLLGCGANIDTPSRKEGNGGFDSASGGADAVLPVTEAIGLSDHRAGREMLELLASRGADLSKVRYASSPWILLC